jgi:NAD(P)-dependent dehydrogenase (short-subunit alcohol dehydrogenase family)
MDALAAGYALEVSRFGIESTIVVPGSFTHGTNHFAHSGKPADADIVVAYETRYAGLTDQVSQKLRELEPAWADVAEVARAIVTVVDTEKGRRPFRVHIDPSDDGAEVVNAVADRVRTEFLRRIELDDLLHPTTA